MTELTETEKALVRSNKPGGQSSPWAMAPLYDTVAVIIDARLAPIRALADEWADADHEPLTRDGLTVLTVTNRLGRDLRAALDATSAPVSAQQDHDGAEDRPDAVRPADRRRGNP